MKVITFSLCISLVAVVLASSGRAQNQVARSPVSAAIRGEENRPSNRMSGQVRRIRVETVNLTMKERKTVEGPGVLRETTTYDQNGQEIDSVTYPAESSEPRGNRQYLYDANGNKIEMVLHGDAGSILNKEKYDYQFDPVGNWKKMTASVAVSENGSVSYEPFEITYRTITYYFSQLASKVINPPVDPPVLNASTTATATAYQVPETKTAEPRNDASVSSAERVSELKKTNHANDALMDIASESLTATPPTSTSKTEAPKAPKPHELNVAPIDQPILEPNSIPPELSSRTSAVPATEPVPGDSLYAKGVALLSAGQDSEAVQALRHAVQQNPNDANAYAKLGIAYASLREHQEAVAVFKMAIRIKPEVFDAEAYSQLSNAYTGLGKFSQSLEAIKQALYLKRAEQAGAEVVNSPRSPSLADLHYLSGLAYYNLRRYSGAIDELKEVLLLNPNRAQVHHGIALAYLANGDRKSAEKHQQVLESLDPVFAAKIAKLLSSPRNNQPGFGMIFKTGP